MGKLQKPPLGRLLRSRRIYFGLSQRDLAQMLDLSQSTYSFIETGKRSLKKPEMEVLGRILEVDSELLQANDKVENDKNVESINNSARTDINDEMTRKPK